MITGKTNCRMIRLSKSVALLFHQLIDEPAGHEINDKNNVNYTVNGCNGGYGEASCPPADSTAC